MHLLLLVILFGFTFNDAANILPEYSQTVYVNHYTPTLTPDGSFENPFTSVSAAMASILDASPSKRYGILVSPGTFTEASTLHLKANVVVEGFSQYSTRLSMSWDINDPSWYNPNATNDDRSGFQQVALVGASNVVDWTVQQAKAGKVSLVSVRMNNPLSVTAYHPINQLYLEETLFFNDVTITGTNTQFYGVQFVNGNDIQLLSTPNSQTLLTAYGHGTDGTFSANYTSGDQAISISLLNWAMQGQFLLSGASCSASVNRAALPGSSQQVITNGASLSIYN